MNLNELDALLAGLRNRHKSWRIWYVPRATAGPEWHAFREPVLTAATAEELEREIDDIEESDAGH